MLLQNASGFYYKMRQFYYKMRQLIQNVTFVTTCDSTRRNVAAVSLDGPTTLILCALEESPTQVAPQSINDFIMG